jgi:hypothetical protein
MILEVNNPFGERRTYLLDGSNMRSPPQTPESEASGPELPLGSKSRFIEIWMKDFHISPFNSREGSYALKALNPFPYASYEEPTIDNTITLMSSKSYAKLVARCNSVGKAIVLDKIGVIGTTQLVFHWWWVGLLTFPRFLAQSYKLYFTPSVVPSGDTPSQRRAYTYLNGDVSNALFLPSIY